MRNYSFNRIQIQVGNKFEKEHVFSLTCRSVAVAWDGEHVAEFSQRVFLVFVSISYYRCVFHLYHGKVTYFIFTIFLNTPDNMTVRKLAQLLNII